MTLPSIGIAGAGIMGRLLAWQLQARGYPVTLFDRDPVESGGAAAYTAAGMLAPFCELESAEDEVFRLGQRSMQLWPALVQALGAEAYFHQGGSLVVAHTPDAPYLTQFNRTLQHKLPGDPCIRYLDQAGLREKEPELATHFQQATFLEGEAWLYTKELMATLAHRLMACGVRWHAGTTVTALSPGRLSTADTDHPFDWVIDCRGLGAKADIPRLRGVRGEVIRVQAPEVPLRHMVRLMHPRYRLYLVPRDDHHFILGATSIESEDSSQISVRSALELLSALYSLHPGFAEARVVETLTNCRPALLDNLPAVVCTPGHLQVNGLYRHGYLLAPALAEQAIQALEESEGHPARSAPQTSPTTASQERCL